MVTTAKVPRTTAVTVLNSNTVCLAPNLTRGSLFVFNPGLVQLYICADDTVATVAGAGTILLAPGQGIELDGWTAGLNAIAQTGSSPITIHEYI